MIYLQYHSFNHPSAFNGIDRVHLEPETFKRHVIEISKTTDIKITFDDGSPSVFYVARPILEEFNKSAIIFIDTEGIANRRMNRENIRHLSDAGFSIQSHSHNHRNHYHLSDEEIRKEGLISKEILEDITGKLVYQYSFPHAPYTKRICDVLHKVGYESFFTSDYGTKTKNQGGYSISQRINIHKERELDYFLRSDVVILNRFRIELSKFRLRYFDLSGKK